MTDKSHHEPAFNENRQVAPFYESFSNLKREIDKVFSNFGRASWSDLLPRTMGFSTLSHNPSADITENDEVFEISVELPGIEEKDVSLSLSDGILTLKGEKKQEFEKKEKGYRMVERSYGSFERSFRLPPNVDQDKITASFKNGVITITAPKTDQLPSGHRKIEIKSS